MGFLELQRQCGVSHDVLRGAQGASHVALGKSGLHAHCEGVQTQQPQQQQQWKGLEAEVLNFTAKCPLMKNRKELLGNRNRDSLCFQPPKQ